MRVIPNSVHLHITINVARDFRVCVMIASTSVRLKSRQVQHQRQRQHPHRHLHPLQQLARQQQLHRQLVCRQLQHQHLQRDLHRRRELLQRPDRVLRRHRAHNYSMKKKRTPQFAPARHSRLLRRAYSAEAAAKAGSSCEGWIGEGGFLRLCISLGMLVFLAGILPTARPRPTPAPRP